MFLINEVSKKLIYSHGKCGTTSVAKPLLESNSDWQELDHSHLEVHPYGKYRNYTAYILFREPYDRYISGLLEDISMFMLPDQEGLKYARQIISLNNDAQILSHKQISDDRSAVLLVEKNEKYYQHMVTQILKYNGNDYSLSQSYHVGNWLWEAFAIHSLADKTIWIDLPNLDSYFKQHFDLELPRLNVKSSRDKSILRSALKGLYHKNQIDDYLSTEYTMYSIIMNNRNSDFTLKDFADNHELAHKLSYCVYDNFSRKKNHGLADDMVKSLISLIYQKHWNKK
jgi:hypothetical protein